MVIPFLFSRLFLPFSNKANQRYKPIRNLRTLSSLLKKGNKATNHSVSHGRPTYILRIKNRIGTTSKVSDIQRISLQISHPSDSISGDKYYIYIYDENQYILLFILEHKLNKEMWLLLTFGRAGAPFGIVKLIHLLRKWFPNPPILSIARSSGSSYITW